MESTEFKPTIERGMPEEFEGRWQKKYLDELKIKAIRALDERSVSYRKFFVGVAILTYNTEKRKYRIDFCGNFKPVKDDSEEGETKRCAERRALEKAKKYGSDVVVGIVIASPRTDTEKTEEKKEKTNSTLPSCDECCKMYGQEDMVKPWTKVLTIKIRKFDKIRDKNIFEDLKIVDEETREVKPVDLDQFIVAQEESDIQTILAAKEQNDS